MTALHEFHVHTAIYKTHVVAATDAHEAARIVQEGEHRGEEHVTGAEIQKVTEPVRLDQPIDDLPDLRDNDDAYFAGVLHDRFGPAWRSLELHDGNGTSLDLHVVDRPEWGYDGTPEGLKKTAELLALRALRDSRKPTNREVTILIGWLLQAPERWSIRRGDLVAVLTGSDDED